MESAKYQNLERVKIYDKNDEFQVYNIKKKLIIGERTRDIFYEFSILVFKMVVSNWH